MGEKAGDPANVKGMEKSPKADVQKDGPNT